MRVLLVLLPLWCYVSTTNAATYLNMASLPSVPVREIKEGNNGLGQSYAMVPALADIVAYGLNVLFMMAMGGVALMAVGPIMALARSTSLFSTKSRMEGDGNDLAENESLITRVWNGMDLVESTFSALRVRSDGCRRRVACEVAKESEKSFWMGMALGWLRNRLERKDNYRDAVEAGMRKSDCIQQFPDCSYTFADTIKLRG